MKRGPYALLLLMLLAEREGDGMYGGHWHSPFLLIGRLFFVPLPGLRLQLWDLCLGALLLRASLRPGALARRARPLDLALVGTLAAWLWAVAVGLVRGGSAHQAYFQLRLPLITLALAALFLAELRRERDLQRLGRTLVAAALVRGGLAIYFYYAYVRGHPELRPYPQTMTTHDDSVLFVAGIVIALAWAAARRTWRAWRAALAVTLWLLLAVQVNNRRLAWISLVLALGFMYLGLAPGGLRRRVHRALPVMVPLLALYVALGWGRQERIFAPVRTFSSITGEREDDSSKARNEENRNLAFTLAQSPILGWGLGREYVEMSSRYSPHLKETFPQYRYIPHNSLLALVAFTGLVGFGPAALLFGVAVFLGARLHLQGPTPVLRAAGLAASALVVVYLNQAFGDMGLQTPAPAMVLAASLGAIGRGSILAGAWPDRGPKRSPRA